MTHCSMNAGSSPKVGWKWKWSNGTGKSEMSIIWCISITNNVKWNKKFNETAQMANFTVFTMCGRELPAILRGTANAETVGQNHFF